MSQFNLYDKVKVIDNNGRTIKEGIIMVLTTTGARIYNDKASREEYHTDSIVRPEWFAFKSDRHEIKLIQPNLRSLTS